MASSTEPVAGSEQGPDSFLATTRRGFVKSVDTPIITCVAMSLPRTLDALDGTAATTVTRG